jgi:hypothetical protein
MWWLALLGCEPDAPPAPSLVCDGAGDEQLVVIRQLRFQRQTDGLSDGFDLDGTVSTDGGVDGCGIEDLVSPDGVDGVDNAFAYLLPALELTEAAAVESLVQATIDSGSLLISLELADLDDPTDDRCVDLAVGRAVGTPMIGTDGRMLTGQTFDPDPDFARFVVPETALVGGVFEAPLSLELPVSIFAVDLVFALPNGRIRGTLHEDGTVTGVFGGGVEIADLLAIAREENVDPGLHDVMASLLGAWADLAPGADGVCTEVSITFAFEAVPAFWYETI